MAVTSWRTPGSVADPEFFWYSSGAQAAASDDTHAFIDSFDGPSGYLVATQFSFTDIPAGSVITGIEVAIERYQEFTSTNYRDSSITLVSGGSQLGSPKTPSGVFLPENIDGTATYGGATDLWGANVSLATAQGSSFGFRYSIWSTNNIFNGAYVDSMQMRVHYTPPAGGAVCQLMIVG